MRQCEVSDTIHFSLTQFEVIFTLCIAAADINNLTTVEHLCVCWAGPRGRRETKTLTYPHYLILLHVVLSAMATLKIEN